MGLLYFFRGISPLILNLCTRWRLVVNFTSSWFRTGKKTLFPGIGVLAGLTARLNILKERKMSTHTGNRTPYHPARSLFAMPTEIPRLREVATVFICLIL
jgi:hypothetical protein